MEIQRNYCELDNKEYSRVEEGEHKRGMQVTRRDGT